MRDAMMKGMVFGAPGDEESEETPGDSGEDMGTDDLELSAAQDAMNAKSPEEWKAAMKAFMEACYPSLTKGDDY